MAIDKKMKARIDIEVNSEKAKKDIQSLYKDALQISKHGFIMDVDVENGEAKVRELISNLTSKGINDVTIRFDEKATLKSFGATQDKIEENVRSMMSNIQNIINESSFGISQKNKSAISGGIEELGKTLEEQEKKLTSFQRRLRTKKNSALNEAYKAYKLNPENDGYAAAFKKIYEEIVIKDKNNKMTAQFMENGNTFKASAKELKAIYDDVSKMNFSEGALNFANEQFKEIEKRLAKAAEDIKYYKKQVESLDSAKTKKERGTSTSSKEKEEDDDDKDEKVVKLKATTENVEQFIKDIESLARPVKLEVEASNADSFVDNLQSKLDGKKVDVGINIDESMSPIELKSIASGVRSKYIEGGNDQKVLIDDITRIVDMYLNGANISEQKFAEYHAAITQLKNVYGINQGKFLRDNLGLKDQGKFDDFMQQYQTVKDKIRRAEIGITISDKKISGIKDKITDGLNPIEITLELADGELDRLSKQIGNNASIKQFDDDDFDKESIKSRYNEAYAKAGSVIDKKDIAVLAQEAIHLLKENGLDDKETLAELLAYGNYTKDDRNKFNESKKLPANEATVLYEHFLREVGISAEELVSAFKLLSQEINVDFVEGKPIRTIESISKDILALQSSLKASENAKEPYKVEDLDAVRKFINEINRIDPSKNPGINKFAKDMGLNADEFYKQFQARNEQLKNTKKPVVKTDVQVPTSETEDAKKTIETKVQPTVKINIDKEELQKDLDILNAAKSKVSEAREAYDQRTYKNARTWSKREFDKYLKYDRNEIDLESIASAAKEKYFLNEDEILRLKQYIESLYMHEAMDNRGVKMSRDDILAGKREFEYQDYDPREKIKQAEREFDIALSRFEDKYKSQFISTKAESLLGKNANEILESLQRSREADQRIMDKYLGKKTSTSETEEVKNEIEDKTTPTITPTVEVPVSEVEKAKNKIETGLKPEVEIKLKEAEIDKQIIRELQGNLKLREEIDDFIFNKYMGGVDPQTLYEIGRGKYVDSKDIDSKTQKPTIDSIDNLVYDRSIEGIEKLYKMASYISAFSNSDGGESDEMWADLEKKTDKSLQGFRVNKGTSAPLGGIVKAAIEFSSKCQELFDSNQRIFDLADKYNDNILNDTENKRRNDALTKVENFASDKIFSNDGRSDDESSSKQWIESVVIELKKQKGVNPNENLQWINMIDDIVRGYTDEEIDSKYLKDDSLNKQREEMLNQLSTQQQLNEEKKEGLAIDNAKSEISHIDEIREEIAAQQELNNLKTQENVINGISNGNGDGTTPPHPKEPEPEIIHVELQPSVDELIADINRISNDIHPIHIELEPSVETLKSDLSGLNLESINTALNNLNNPENPPTITLQSNVDEIIAKINTIDSSDAHPIKVELSPTIESIKGDLQSLDNFPIHGDLGDLESKIKTLKDGIDGLKKFNITVTEGKSTSTLLTKVQELSQIKEKTFKFDVSIAEKSLEKLENLYKSIDDVRNFVEPFKQAGTDMAQATSTLATQFQNIKSIISGLRSTAQTAATQIKTLREEADKFKNLNTTNNKQTIDDSKARQQLEKERLAIAKAVIEEKKASILTIDEELYRQEKMNKLAESMLKLKERQLKLENAAEDRNWKRQDRDRKEAERLAKEQEKKDKAKKEADEEDDEKVNRLTDEQQLALQNRVLEAMRKTKNFGGNEKSVKAYADGWITLTRVVEEAGNQIAITNYRFKESDKVFTKRGFDLKKLKEFGEVTGRETLSKDQIKSKFISLAQASGLQYDEGSVKVLENNVITYTNTLKEGSKVVDIYRHKIENLDDLLIAKGKKISKTYVDQSNSGKSGMSISAKELLDEKVSDYEEIVRQRRTLAGRKDQNENVKSKKFELTKKEAVLENEINAELEKQELTHKEIASIKERMLSATNGGFTPFEISGVTLAKEAHKLEENLEKIKFENLNDIEVLDGDQFTSSFKILERAKEEAKELYSQLTDGSIASKKEVDELTAKLHKQYDIIDKYTKSDYKKDLTSKEKYSRFLKLADEAGLKMDRGSLDVDDDGIITYTHTIIEAGKVVDTLIVKITELEKVMKNGSLSEDFVNKSNIGSKNLGVGVEVSTNEGKAKVNEALGRFQLANKEVRTLKENLEQLQKIEIVDASDEEKKRIEEQRTILSEKLEKSKENVLRIEKEIVNLVKQENLSMEHYTKTMNEMKSGKFKPYQTSPTTLLRESLQYDKTEKRMNLKTILDDENSRRLNTAWSDYNKFYNRLTSGAATSAAEVDKLTASLRKQREVIYELTSGQYLRTNEKGTLVNIPGTSELGDRASFENKLRKYLEDKGYKNIESKGFKGDIDQGTLQATFSFLDKQSKRIKTVIFNIEELKSQYGELGLQIREVNKLDAENLSIGKKWLTGVKAKIGNLTQYITGMELVMRVWNQTMQGFQFVKELDTSMTTIYETMDITRAELGELSSQAIKTAKDLGAVATQMIDSVNIYAAYGKTVDEMLSQATPTVMLANATQGSAEESSDFIQGVIQQYKELEGQETRIVNTYEKIGSLVQIDFPKAVQGMAEGVQVAGSVMREAGVDFELYAASLSKVMEVTRSDGSQIANAMKTIAARISRAKTGDEEATAEERSNASKAYGSVGIDVYNEDGSYRGLNNILDELADKWDTLTDAQKNYIAEQSAGVRNINVFTTMLDTWGEAQTIANEAIEDSSYYLEVQEKHMESMQAKLNQLQAQMQEFWYNLINTETVNAIIDAASLLMSGASMIVNAFSSIGSVFGDVGSGVGGMTALAGMVFTAANAWTSFNKKLSTTTTNPDGSTTTTTQSAGFGGMLKDFKTFTKEVKTKGKTIIDTFVDGFKNGVGEAGHEVKGLVGGFKALTTASGETAAVLTKFQAAALGIGAALAAVGAGVIIFDIISTSSEEAAQNAKESTEEYRKLQKELKNNKKVIDSVSDEYRILSEGVDPSNNKNISLTTDEYNRYLDICNQIADMYPSLVNSYDEQGNAILTLKGNVADLNKEYEEARLNAARTNTNSLSDYAEDFKNKTGNRDWTTYIADSWNDWGDAEVGGRLTEGDATKILEKVNNMTLDEFNAYLKDLRVRGESDSSAGDELSYLVGDDLLNLGFFDRIKGTIEVTEEQFKTMRTKIPALATGYNSVINDSAAQVKSAMQSLLLTMQLDEETYGDFIDLDSNVFNQISGMFNNMTSKQIEELFGDSEDIEWAIRTYMYDFVKAINDDPAAQISLNNLLNLDSDATIDEMQGVISNNLPKLANALGYKEDGEIAQLVEQLGLTEIKELVDGFDEDVEDINKNLNKTTKENKDQVKYHEKIKKFIKDEKINTKSELALLKQCAATSESWAETMHNFSLTNIDVNVNDEELSNLKSNLTTVSDTIDKIDEATQASYSPKGLTSEQIENIKSAFSDLKDEAGNALFDYDKLFEASAEGVRLNAQELDRLNGLYEEAERNKYDKKLEELQDQYARTCTAIDKATTSTEKYELINRRDYLSKQIQQAQELKSQYEGLTNAVTKYQRAKELGEEGDTYLSIFEDKEEIEKLYNNGLVGTNQFKAAVQMMTDKDMSGASVTEYIETYKEKWSQFSSWLTEDASGLQKFLKDLEGKGFASEDNGFWTIDGDIEAMSAELGTSQAIIQEIFKRLKDFGFDVDFREETDHLKALREEAEKLRGEVSEEYKLDLTVKGEDDIDAQIKKGEELLKKLDAESDAYKSLRTQVDYLRAVAGQTADALNFKLNYNDNKDEIDGLITKLNSIEAYKDVYINFQNVNITNVDNQIDEVTSKLDKLKDPETGKINMSAPGATELSDILIALINKKIELTNTSAVLKLDSHNLDENYSVIIEKMQNIKNKMNEIDALEAQAALGVDISEDKTSLEGELQGLIDDLNTTAQTEEGKKLLVGLGFDDSDAPATQANMQKVLDGLTAEKLVNLKVITPEEAQATLDYVTGEEDLEVDVLINDRQYQLLKQDFDKVHDVSAKVNMMRESYDEFLKEVKQPITKTVYTETVAKSSSSSSAASKSGLFPNLFGGDDFVNGTANAQGNARSTLLQRGLAFAKGTWGAAKSGMSLVGELGRELVNLLPV